MTHALATDLLPGHLLGFPLAQTEALWLTPAQMLSVVLMVGGMLVLAWACRGGSGPPRPSAPRRAGRAFPEPAPIDPDPRSVVGDAEELLQLLAEQADQHAARLERLIADADARIRKLEQVASAASARPRPERADPLNQQIYQLSDEGLPPVEIARQLEQQTGKVELVLALRRR
jgi:hypothetical protein